APLAHVLMRRADTMNAEPNPAKALFLEAVERHAPERWPAFLDRACAGRPELRGLVEALLAAHREVGTAEHRALGAGAGQRLAAAFADGTVHVWEIQSEKLLHTFRHGDRVRCVAFHPNGKQLASGSCDNTAKVWDLETDQEVETLRGHIGYVMALAYSPDGS